MHIAFESPNQADAIALIAELDAYQHTLYPAESVYALDLTSVVDHQLMFAMARDDDGLAVACGAVVLSGDYAELKRMYVRPAQRGRGLATQILQTLEAAATQAACRSMKLETGPYQTEALALYARCGYARCGRFGSYADDPLSVFMQKTLASQQ